MHLHRIGSLVAICFKSPSLSPRSSSTIYAVQRTQHHHQQTDPSLSVMGGAQALKRIPRIKFPKRHPNPSGPPPSTLFFSLLLCTSINDDLPKPRKSFIPIWKSSRVFSFSFLAGVCIRSFSFCSVRWFLTCSLTSPVFIAVVCAFVWFLFDCLELGFFCLAWSDLCSYGLGFICLF